MSIIERLNLRTDRVDFRRELPASLLNRGAALFYVEKYNEGLKDANRGIQLREELATELERPSSPLKNAS